MSKEDIEEISEFAAAFAAAVKQGLIINSGQLQLNPQTGHCDIVWIAREFAEGEATL